MESTKLFGACSDSGDFIILAGFVNFISLHIHLKAVVQHKLLNWHRSIVWWTTDGPSVCWCSTNFMRCWFFDISSNTKHRGQYLLNIASDNTVNSIDIIVEHCSAVMLGSLKPISTNESPPSNYRQSTIDSGGRAARNIVLSTDAFIITPLASTHKTCILSKWDIRIRI